MGRKKPRATQASGGTAGAPEAITWSPGEASNLRRLFDGIPIGVYVSTPSGRLLDANAALAGLLGFESLDSLLSVGSVDGLYEDPADRARWQALVATGDAVRGFEFRLKKRDGEIVWARDTSRAVRDAQGRISWYEGVIEDITDRRRAEESSRIANERLTALVEELEGRTVEMESLSEMVDLLQSCQSGEEAFAVLAERMPRLFRRRAGVVSLLNPSKKLLEAVAVWGEHGGDDRIFAPEDCWALRRGRTHSVSEEQGGALCRHVDPQSARRYVCVPMMAQGEALGVLTLHSPPRSVAERAGGTDQAAEHNLAASVAEQIALSLANLKLRESLRHQSIRDPLTGLYNRRYMEESLDRELHRADRRHAQVGIIMLDLDHFKQFNDTFGHLAGDALLRALGDHLGTRFRREDIVCRYGGEEFAVILPEASLEATTERAEEMRMAAKSLNVPYRGQSLGGISISLGVAAFPDHGSTAETLLRAADSALYRAKSQGRDRVVAATT